ncbi:allantoate amidohydrolase [Knoellia sp. GCM10027209]|uniref:allantoate amidohydrolase n=1 Tax=Knoellia sp. GCM10027209 TaxID=3273396 RepID=UPI00362393F4
MAHRPGTVDSPRGVANVFDPLWSALEPVGRDPRTGGYRRFAWTREDHTLREWFAAEAAARGLDLVEDRVGNQWAWWGDPDAAAERGLGGVVTGSHLDSVPDGGAFDGPLGVVSALVAIDLLRAAAAREGWQPARPIGVVNFADEEGARFGVACAGSRLITGALAASKALALTDADGTSLAEALRRAGRDPHALGPDPQALRRVGCFVELHVEQGRALADLDHPVAVGTGIWPHGRWRLDFPGEANHAGTTRLADRHDAMLGYAAAVLTARAAAERHGCLATIGKVAVQPGGVNAIPSGVTGWLDARGADEAAVRATVDQVRDEALRAGATVTEESWTPTTAFDADLARRLRGTLGAAGPKGRPDGIPVLGTGAGHDAGILANAGVSAAMLFVRNPTGVSHSPREWAEPDDCRAGVRALAAVLRDLAGEGA